MEEWTEKMMNELILTAAKEPFLRLLFLHFSLFISLRGVEPLEAHDGLVAGYQLLLKLAVRDYYTMTL